MGHTLFLILFLESLRGHTYRWQAHSEVSHQDFPEHVTGTYHGLCSDSQAPGLSLSSVKSDMNSVCAKGQQPFTEVKHSINSPKSVSHMGWGPGSLWRGFSTAACVHGRWGAPTLIREKEGGSGLSRVWVDGSCCLSCFHCCCS